MANLNQQYILSITITKDMEQKITLPSINLAIISDFYKPYTGGVELHIQKLIHQLQRHVRKIIVITHKYQQFGQEYVGVRETKENIRVYYLNIPYHRNKMVTLSTFIMNFPEAKRIFQYQQINLVHGHQSSSTLVLEYIFYCRVLDVKVILTEHSIVGFKKLSNIVFNKFTKLFFPKCQRIIAVSKTLRNNIIVRSQISPSMVTVIPNGVENLGLTKKIRTDSEIRIIIVGRLTQRRGTDLLIQSLPSICQINERIRIWIAGEGPKLSVLKSRIQMSNISEQVKLLGVIQHNELLQCLTNCDIFLNTPLTQSFGIALAEAAQVGLFCISTKVGAVKQSIPNQLLLTVNINSSSILNGIKKAILRLKKGNMNINNKFEYKWQNVEKRTLEVYKKVIQQKNQTKIFMSSYLDYIYMFIWLILTLMNFLYGISFSKNRNRKIPKTFNKGF